VTDTQDRWERKDAWLGVLFLVFGLLITITSVVWMRRGTSPTVHGTGFVLGPILVLLGANAIVRSLASRGPREP
jgi:hypothetical protein